MIPALLGLAVPAQTPVIVQPGSPGKPSTTLAAPPAKNVAKYTKADATFMQGMIHHHAQAIEMVELQGGVSVFDFTDGAKPVEIAFFDRGPLSASKLIIGGYWSTYWYNGYIYASEIARGLDVLKLTPSDMLTQNEIDAANLVKFDELNVQSQPKFVWPAHPSVAKAYLDQLARSKAIPADRIAAAMSSIDAFDKASGAARTTAKTALNTMAAEFTKDAATAKGADANRLKALGAVLVAMK